MAGSRLLLALLGVGGGAPSWRLAEGPPREAPAEPEAGCFGWECPSADAVSPGLADRRGKNAFCDIPVLSAAAASGAEKLPDGPFVIRGAALEPETRQALGREALLEAAAAGEKNLSVRIGNSWDIVMNQGEGPYELSLAQFISEVMHRDVHDGEDRLERPYAFDGRSAILSLEGVALRVPEAIAALNQSAFTPSSAKSVFLLGGPESGVGFHRHASAVQINFHGTKRWLFYPPEGNPPGGVHGGWPMLDWMRVVYPELQGRWAPRECIQHPGDVMCIPEGWYHATVNLADSVAVSLQRVDMSTKFLKLEVGAKLAGAAETKAKLLRRLIKLQPENLEAKLQLFMALARIQDESPQKTLEVVKEVISRDRFLVEAQYTLIQFLSNMEGNGDAGARQSLDRALGRFVPYLANNTRNVQANYLLAQHHLIEGRKEEGLAYLKRNLALKELGVVDLRMQNVEEHYLNVAEPTMQNESAELPELPPELASELPPELAAAVPRAQPAASSGARKAGRRKRRKTAAQKSEERSSEL